MANWAFHVRCHYSGLLMGHCPDEPGLVVLARDHDELASLMEKALNDRRSSGSAHPRVDAEA